MAQQDPSRTETATQKRRNKARNEGNVPKSQEISKPIILLGGLIALRICLGYIWAQMEGLFRLFTGPALNMSFDPATVYDLFVHCIIVFAKMVLPVLLIVATCAFVVMRLQVGNVWASKVLKPKLRLNILAGIKRLILDPKAIVRLFRSLGQASAVGFATFLVLKAEFFKVTPLFFADVSGIAAYILAAGFTMTQYALVPMLIIGIADLVYTRWDYEENLKMTKDEVKDERKQAEGDPKIKNQQKRKMMAVMQQRMLAKVPEADVVITNPTHFAVALKYNPMQAPAPIVLAKGVNHMAEKIKAIARENRVPIRENKPLARALYSSVQVGDVIPEEMYQAVAAILAQVFKARPGRPH
ncbi:MAG: flagellar biosynthesis protein FlhB [Deltaproteobacteria bacterium]|nr:flagellar biosynthesis protein FlhB [Deltaproteobacteria bacterium]